MLESLHLTAGFHLACVTSSCQTRPSRMRGPGQAIGPFFWHAFFGGRLRRLFPGSVLSNWNKYLWTFVVVALHMDSCPIFPEADPFLPLPPAAIHLMISRLVHLHVFTLLKTMVTTGPCCGDASWMCWPPSSCPPPLSSWRLATDTASWGKPGRQISVWRGFAAMISHRASGHPGRPQEGVAATPQPTMPPVLLSRPTSASSASSRKQTREHAGSTTTPNVHPIAAAAATTPATEGDLLTSSLSTPSTTSSTLRPQPLRQRRMPKNAKGDKKRKRSAQVKRSNEPAL